MPRAARTPVPTHARVSAAALALGLLAALPPAASAQDQLTARLDFLGPNGVPTGTGTALDLPLGVLFEMEVNALPAGQWVAIHVHEGGACDVDGGYQSAGGHFNPSSTPHGYRSLGGPHAGDMPNQYIPNDGILRTHIYAPLLALRGGAADIRGRTMVIHAAADDYETQPSGGAGDRIACAVIS